MRALLPPPLRGKRKYINDLEMNITNLNAHALMNTAKSLIETLRNNKKATISKVVTEWNVCVEQSGYTTTFDFPVDGWTRKAQVIADLERCASQLEVLAFATETLTVRASNNEAQTTDVLTNPEGENTMNTIITDAVNAMLAMAENAVSLFGEGDYAAAKEQQSQAVAQARNLMEQGATTEQHEQMFRAVAETVFAEADCLYN